MTGVQIHIPSFLQLYTGNISQVYVDGSTIMECLTSLVERFPGLKSLLFNSKDKVRRKLFIYLNKSHVHPHGLSRAVTDGDELYIAHVIAGG